MNKNNTPRRKTLTGNRRLDSAKDWIKKYNGKNLISGYAKWFGVDKICAMNELKTLGVIIPENIENQIIESIKQKNKQRKAAKEKRESLEVPEFEYNFAYIIGYTSGGFPYGLTHDELIEGELPNNE